MSSASARSTNASNGAHQDKITVNRAMCCSINAVVHCHVSQQANNNKVHCALIDGWAYGGVLGEDVQISEHILNGFMNVSGVAGNNWLTSSQRQQLLQWWILWPMAPLTLSSCCNAQTAALGKLSIPRGRWNTLP